MTESASDPFGTIQISQDMIAAQKKLLSAGKFFEQMSTAARIISAAQMEYGQALMQANSVLFGAFLQPPAVAESETRPSEAAHQPDCAA